MKPTTSNNPPNSDEQLLQRVLQDSGALLGDSLRVQERHRRRRRFVSWFLAIGGLVMGLGITAFVAGWLTLAPAPPDVKFASDIKRNPEQAETLFSEGVQLWQGGKPAAAIPKLEQAVEQDPKLVNAWNALGWCRFNTGAQSEAEQAFLKCVELQPRHPAAQNGLGQLYLMWREYDKAEKHLKIASPQAPAAWFGLAKVSMLTGEYADAQKWIRKSLTQQPGDADLKALLADAKAKQLSDDMKAKIEGPGKPKAGGSSNDAAAGWQLFNTGNLPAAEKKFRSAVARDPENGTALNGLGFCLLSSGNAAEAKQYFEKCLELEPKAAGAMNGLARCYKAEGEIAKALELWEKMAKANPGVNAATYGLASTYVEEEEFAKALPHAKQLVASDPGNEEFKRILAAAEQKEEAAE